MDAWEEGRTSNKRAREGFMAEPMSCQSRKHYITLPRTTSSPQLGNLLEVLRPPPQTDQARNWCSAQQQDLHQFPLQGALMYAQVYKPLL